MTQQLESHYAALERRFPLSDGHDYERLVVPQGNSDEAFHRWFHMKEAYSPHLLPRVVKDLNLTTKETMRLHDPFAGSGTTLVSALLQNDGPVFSASGAEVNPFLHLVSSTKMRVLSMSAPKRKNLAATYKSAVDDILREAKKNSRTRPKPPALSAFQNIEYFPRDRLLPLLRIREAWREYSPGITRDLIAIALAGCIEPSSRLRRDGRALRYEANKQPVDPRQLFLERAQLISKDIEQVDPKGSGDVINTSSTGSIPWTDKSESLDLICFSPPYPNNIDYTEIYKLELWFLGQIESAMDFRSQRDNTMRSHPSIRFTERGYLDEYPELTAYTADLSAPILESIPADRYRLQRTRVIEGYLRDAAMMFLNAHRALIPGGHAVYIVGNSRHGTSGGQYTIASDVLLAAIAERVGFDVLEIKVARRLHRRGRQDHLRESTVFLRKR
ncbi:TRM11 family methyltransferase [Mycobacteroides saopaulense]|uniref:hypothetical protein n=1 Tax=Mycobacteroides saopaulense TaxID=1578165 RepID=UPI0012FFB3FB|nr:hypothetical protein [Mycobacteroides saopaulense]